MVAASETLQNQSQPSASTLLAARRRAAARVAAQREAALVMTHTQRVLDERAARLAALASRLYASSRFEQLRARVRAREPARRDC